jgi:hypothetical protein
MAGKFLNQEATQRLFQIAERPYRLPQIVWLRNAIDGEMRAAEMYALSTGVIDFARAMRIVRMKLELDRLYAAWANGLIG